MKNLLFKTFNEAQAAAAGVGITIARALDDCGRIAHGTWNDFRHLKSHRFVAVSSGCSYRGFRTLREVALFVEYSSDPEPGMSYHDWLAWRPFVQRVSSSNDLGAAALAVAKAAA
jgi:hypothetical protein